MTQPVFIWDIGRVLINWRPERAYSGSRLSGHALDWWVENGIPMRWIHMIDEGVAVTDAETLRIRDFPQEHPDQLAQFPDYEDLIRLYCKNFLATLDDNLAESRALRDHYRQRGHKTYALTNFSPELWDMAVSAFPWLDQGFDGIVMSGQEKLAKPDPRFFEILLQRYSVSPTTAIFIDDRADNCETASSLGLTAITFTTPDALRDELQRILP